MIRLGKYYECFKVVEVLVALFVIPFFFFNLLASWFPATLRISYYFIVSLFVFQSALSYLHSMSGFRKERFRERATAKHQVIPKVTFIVSAYLPNELEVIEETLLNLLQNIERPQAGMEVVLAYNSPHLEPLELRLRDLAYAFPELVLANAYNSRSKSENLNYVLGLASGEMIVLIDADHHPRPDCISRAWRWLDEGYDVVQGRCKIRNGKQSIIAALVEVEFETIYGISHYAKSRLFDSALFGGSNGYWKAKVIKAVRFRTDTLTEDIDATLRALLSGYHIVHDRSIVSTELAPTTVRSLWYQRKRWAQGWYQCSVLYQIPVWRSAYLNIRQRFIWTVLLMWRVVYDILGHLLFPILFAYWFYRGKVEFPMTAYIWFALIFTMFSGPFETIAAFKNASIPRPRVAQFICYAFLHFPYTLFKNTIQVVAIRDEILGKRDWVVSPRNKR
ncbi:MAG: glycosyltransferase family 2 protein [Candidatus Omnitrophica bacterium]|nr:glycosyltransferase family 2 protein [Candidatus Omnitrophota bacterium]